MKRHVLLVLMLAVPALAGCAVLDGEAEAASAALAFDFGGARPEGVQNLHAWIDHDPSSRPAADMYATGDRPDAYTVHDLVQEGAASMGLQVEVVHHEGLGHTLDAVDGVRAETGEGEAWYWQLLIDGEPADEGMSTAVVQDGGAYLWRYTHATW